MKKNRKKQNIRIERQHAWVKHLLRLQRRRYDALQHIHGMVLSARQALVEMLHA